VHEKERRARAGGAKGDEQRRRQGSTGALRLPA
jgi:hypothetical protein